MFYFINKDIKVGILKKKMILSSLYLIEGIVFSVIEFKDLLLVLSV